jgi:hydrogenase maturation factor
MAKQPLLIRYSPLGQRYYLITRYTDKGKYIMAHTGYKYDVTEQIDAIAMPIVEQRDALLEACKAARVALLPLTADVAITIVDEKAVAEAMRLLTDAIAKTETPDNDEDAR